MLLYAYVCALPKYLEILAWGRIISVDTFMRAHSVRLLYAVIVVRRLKEFPVDFIIHARI